MPPKRDAEDGGGGGGKKSRLQQKTAAEFFAENKHFAGFESPGKSLFTSIRELVENSLDAAEGIGVLPEVRIELEEISKERFRRLHGLEAVAVEEPADDAPPAKGKKVAGGKRLGGKDYGYYKLTVTDNGCGMKHDEIPKMFGTVLSGTKYGVRQERGKFGLGSKMVLIWSKMSTGLPMRIRSSQVSLSGRRKLS
jgi:DNA topoisomerase-6 subunit B